MTIITPKKSGTEWEQMPERQQDDSEDRQDIFENSLANSVGFDYGDSEQAESLALGLERLLQWISNGSNARAKEIRLQSARYFVTQKNQVELAKEIGVKKATISQQAVALRDYFAIKLPAGAAKQMRSESARKTFSKVCKSNHEKRKTSSESTGSQTRSPQNSSRQCDLRERVLKAATQP